MGYLGNLRFVAFGYFAHTRQFCSCDGGDNIPANEDFWQWFVRHPLIAPFVSEHSYPTLYGRLPEMASAPSLARSDRQDGSFTPAHCLLLDREARQFYLSRYDQTTIFFALTEPDDRDDHPIFVDGLLMSAGNEDYKVPLQVEVTEKVRKFFDDR